MTVDEVKDFFKNSEKSSLDFDQIKNPKHKRADLCAFLMLADLFSEDKRDIVDGAEHDTIYLNINLEKFAAIATPELIEDLLCCGVSYNNYIGSFYMDV